MLKKSATHFCVGCKQGLNLKYSFVIYSVTGILLKLNVKFLTIIFTTERNSICSFQTSF